MRDIEEAARDILSNVLYYANDGEGIEDLRDKAMEEVWTAADGMCTYYHQCEEYISDLEGTYGGDVDDSGIEYPASEWRQAMQFYALQLVELALSFEVDEQLTTWEEETDLFWEEVQRLADHYKVEFDSMSADYDNECRYGWAAHNYETAEGVMVWSDESGHFNAELLEGELVAASLTLSCGIWIHACFDPRENQVTTE